MPRLCASPVSVTSLGCRPKPPLAPLQTTGTKRQRKWQQRLQLSNLRRRARFPRDASKSTIRRSYPHRVSARRPAARCSPRRQEVSRFERRFQLLLRLSRSCTPLSRPLWPTASQSTARDRMFLQSIGTRIIYDRKFIMSLRHSPQSRTPPSNLPIIPGVTAPKLTTAKHPPIKEVPEKTIPIGTHVWGL